MSEWFEYVPGVKTKKLGAEDGRGFYLMRMDAGAKVERGSHLEKEVLVVLDGAIEVSYWILGRQRPYTYVIKRDGSASVNKNEEHEVCAPYGALVLVIAHPDFEVPDAQG